MSGRRTARVAVAGAVLVAAVVVVVMTWGGEDEQGEGAGGASLSGAHLLSADGFAAEVAVPEDGRIEGVVEVDAEGSTVLLSVATSEQRLVGAQQLALLADGTDPWWLSQADGMSRGSAPSTVPPTAWWGRGVPSDPAWLLLHDDGAFERTGHGPQPTLEGTWSYSDGELQLSIADSVETYRAAVLPEGELALAGTNVERVLTPPNGEMLLLQPGSG